MANIFIKLGCGGVDVSQLICRIDTALWQLEEILSPGPVLITSTWEGDHLANSKHYQRAAIDVRFPHGRQFEIVQELKERLGKDYDVVPEKDHIHIEWDPKE